MSAPGLTPLRIGFRGRCLAVTPPTTTVSSVSPGPALNRRHKSNKSNKNNISEIQPRWADAPSLRLGRDIRRTFERLHRKSAAGGGVAHDARPPAQPVMNAEISECITQPTLNRPLPIRKLLRSMRGRDDKEVWHRYTKIISEPQVYSALRRADYQALIMSLKPADTMRRTSRSVRSPTGQTVVLSRPYTYHTVLRARFPKVHNFMTKNIPGFRYSLHEYNRWLELARAGRDWRLGGKLWQAMLMDHRVGPNVRSFNAYMSIVCHLPSKKRWNTTTEHRLALRKQFSAGPGVRDPGEGERAKPNMAMRGTALVTKLLEEGLEPDSMTFGLLVSSFGWVGDFDAVETTLKDVWGVDIQAIQNGTALLTTHLKRDHPVYPTPHTFSIITKIYASAGEVRLAIDIVNYMSQVFRVPINLATWSYLLNWTYHWAHTKHYPRTVKMASVSELWKVMTDNDVQPTFRMYDYHIRHLIKVRQTDEAQVHMEEALKMYEKLVAHYHATMDKYHSSEDVTETRRADELSRKLEVELSIRRSMIKRWVELLVYGRTKATAYSRFDVVGVPKIIEKWARFINEKIIYVTKGGLVEMIVHRNGFRPIPIRRPQQTRKPPRSWTSQRGARWGEGAKEEDIF